MKKELRRVYRGMLFINKMTPYSYRSLSLITTSEREMLRSVWKRQEFDSYKKRVRFPHSLGCKLYWPISSSTKRRWMRENTVLFAGIRAYMWCAPQNAYLCGVRVGLLVHVCVSVCGSSSWHWTYSSTTLCFIHWAGSLAEPKTCQFLLR